MGQRLTLMDDGSLRCYRTQIIVTRMGDGSVRATHPLSDTPLAINARGFAWDCYKAAVTRLAELVAAGASAGSAATTNAGEASDAR
jgi:hypothetical protein